jgi:2-polyprenyl-6-methoxyphenol hydroxylase-like FAD-dependent oxidoreductase
MDRSFDIVIVGGRVAGSTLAALLGETGFSVLLLDRATFPSDTLSTHVIYGDSFGVWQRIGAWDDIGRLGVAKLWGISWIRDGRPDIRGRFWPVTELITDGGRVTGVRFDAHDREGRTQEFAAQARLTAGCDGRRSLVARSVEAKEYIVDPPINFAFYTYVEGVAPGPDPQPMFEIWDSDVVGGTPMLAECDSDIWMSIVYLPQGQFDEFRAQKDANFWKAIDSDPRIGPRMRTGTQVAPIRGAGDFVNFVRDPVGDGWVLVGDAGQHKDPIFGQGIGDAVRSAEFLADGLAEAESAGLDWSAALASFRAKRDIDLIPNYKWMIQGKPTDLTASEFESIFSSLGSDTQHAEEFINLFSHAVSGSEFFGRLHASRLMGKDPASFDTRHAQFQGTKPPAGPV